MTRRNFTNRTALNIGTALIALSATPAFAQTSDTPAPAQDGSTAATDTEASGEVVVTARKRAERLVDVPIAVTSLSADQLAKQGSIDLSGVQGTIPNVNLVQGRASSSNANIFIRGVGQPDALQTFDPAVGIYVDGVYMSRIQGALFSLFDVDHIEVLRGPQGTLYGKNTIGGAVNVVSRKPSLTQTKALGSFTYGSYDQTLANAYVSTPLGERAAISIAGVYDKRDGTVTDPITGRHYNDRNTQAVRAIVLLQPTERLELLLSGDYLRQRTRPSLGYQTAPLVRASFLGGATIFPAFPYGPYDYKASTSLTPGQGQKLDHYGASLTANYKLSDALTLSSITAYRRLKPDFYIDFDATQREIADAFVGVRQHQFSQELQLKLDTERLKGVFGLYYLDERVKSHQESYDDDLFTLGATPITFTRFIDDRQRTRSYAAFGQLTYDLTGKLSVTGGLRYTKEDKRYDRITTTVSSLGALNAITFAFPQGLPAPFNADDTISFDAWTPSATLSYKPTRDTLLYASASRGFKSGGFNGRVNSAADVTQLVGGVPTIVPFFKPETVWTYEGGAKGNFLGGRVQLSGDVFYSDYRNFQARVGGGSASAAANGSFPVLNAGKLRIWGIEAELAVRPTSAWTIRSTAGYLNAEYKTFADGRRTAPVGSDSFSCNPTGAKIVCEPAFAPPITFSLSSDYAIPLGNVGSLTVGGDVRFVDEHYLSVDNRENLKEGGYTLLNAFVQFDAAGGRYYVRGGVKNLLKTIYLTDAQEFSSVGNIQTGYYGDPRTWTGTVGFRF